MDLGITTVVSTRNSRAVVAGFLGRFLARTAPAKEPGELSDSLTDRVQQKQRAFIPAAVLTLPRGHFYSSGSRAWESAASRPNCDNPSSSVQHPAPTSGPVIRTSTRSPVLKELATFLLARCLVINRRSAMVRIRSNLQSPFLLRSTTVSRRRPGATPTLNSSREMRDDGIAQIGQSRVMVLRD